MSLIQEFLHAHQNECDWMGIREYTEKDQTKYSRNGKTSENNFSFHHGVMIEILLNGQHTYAATSDLSQAGLNNAFNKAKDMAIAIQGHQLFDFNSAMRPSYSGTYKTTAQYPVDFTHSPKIMETLNSNTKKLKAYQHAVEAYGWAKVTNTTVNYYSTSGHEIEQEFLNITRDLGLVANKNGLIQKRTAGMLGMQWGLEAFDTFDHEVERIKREMDELLNAKECPTETMDLILTPDQLYLQVHESIGHPLEIDRIIGDERNYAGWSFINPEDFGRLQYGSDILNVTYDPTLSGGMASFAYDDNGVAAKKEYLIKEGKLVRGIGGIESQKRSGLPGVSCARATSWNRPAIDRMGNINIEPGTSSLEEMIKSTEKGILMETNNSWSIDDYRNKFQFGCEYARLIKDGELKEVVHNPNYRGQTVPFWSGLTHVGDETTFKVWGSPYCGKGEPNQIIRVGHAVPTCKFTNIEVFGGA